MICTNCHKTNDNDAQFCVYCGSDIKPITGKKVWNVGGEPDNDIIQDYPMVSGHHCQIFSEGNKLVIQDLDSKNGTYVNGERIPPFQNIPFNSDDAICLGSHRLSPDILSSILYRQVIPSQKPEPAWTGKIRISIGRGPENDIVLDFPQISYEHAWLIKDNGNWIIEDRNSKNHTFVNDRSKPVSECKIRPEDTIYFGSYKISATRLLSLKKNTAFGRSELHPVVIKHAETIFGRDPSSTVHLNYPQISWHHAKLIHTKDGFLLQDLGSSNGTFVNGRRITSCHVTPQDTISFGSFVFKLTSDLKHIERRDYRGDIRIDADEITVVAGNRTLLDKISLSIFPSEFVGLMGPSGAGKTTLLLAFNGYSMPKSGCSLINGKSLYENYDSFRGSIGYVPQDDIIHPELTVYEALYYTAKLRLPSDTTDKEISALIDKVSTQLGLLNPNKNIDVRNVIIGSAEKKGISGGQRKRVNLAMELLTDPSLLFLDEPTSGLSSQDTLVVMDVLRKFADEGKTIILTIHQPSLEAYKKMDNVIILSSGKLMYYGPAHPDSLTFFNPDSPAEEVINNADNALKGLATQKEEYWQRKYNQSEYCKTYVEERKNKECKINPTSKKHRKHSRPFNLRQWWTLTSRYFTVKMKDTVNTAILLLQAPVIAFLIAVVFYEKDTFPYAYTPLFLLIVSALWFGTSNSAREIVAENAIYKRERMVNLKIISYVLSKFAVLSLLCFIQCAVIVVVVYFSLNLQGNFLLIFGVTFLAALAGISIGLFISSVSRTQQAAIAIVPLVLLPMVILGGGMLPVAKMNKPSVVLSYAVPSRWSYEQIIHIEYNNDNDINTNDPSRSDLLNISIDHTNELFDKEKKEDEFLLAVICGFIVGFIGLTMLVLKRKDLV